MVKKKQNLMFKICSEQHIVQLQPMAMGDKRKMALKTKTE